jgi:hypothetical protein
MAKNLLNEKKIPDRASVFTASMFLLILLLIYPQNEQNKFAKASFFSTYLICNPLA